MDNIRLSKISRLIQKELSTVFQRMDQTLFGGAMITITEVRVSSDLSIARINVSLFSTTLKPQEVLDKIIEHKSKLRLELGNKIKNQMRKVPELYFHLDDSLDKLERIEKLLRGEDPDQK